MEELTLIPMILEYVDVMYIFMCNLITYLVISTLQSIGIKGKLKKGWKRLLSACIGIIMGVLMVFVFEHRGETVFYSFFIQFLTWDYVIKELKEKLSGKKKDTECE